MPRLTHLIHPHYGRLPINADGPCPSCGAHNAPCYLICPCSPASQTYEEERAEALEAEAEIAAVGFMAWDSAQHRAHGLPCPYDGYHDDPGDDWRTDSDNVSGTPAYKAGFTAGENGEPNHGDSSIVTDTDRFLWEWGWRDGRAWYRREHGDDPPLAGGNAAPVQTAYVPDPGPWPDDNDLPF